MMQTPSVISSPSGRVPEKASTWDRRRTEACGGGKSVSGGSLGVPGISEFIEVELGQTEPHGAHKVIGGSPRVRHVALSSPRLSYELLPKLLGSLMCKKKLSKSFVAFGLRLVLIFWKTKNKQKTTTGTRHLVNRLVPRNDIKQHKMHIKYPRLII